MPALAFVLLFAPVILTAIGFGAYPLVLLVLHRRQKDFREDCAKSQDFPHISVVIACHNGEVALRRTLLSLFRSGYPREYVQIVVASDASSDGTDAVARHFSDRGVQLVRLPHRSGKTASENAAGPLLSGDVVVCMDAGSLLGENALQRLVAAFSIPAVGVCSAADQLSGSHVGRGESLLTRLEMRIRALESLAGLSVGASGNLYAVRRELFDDRLDPTLTRDFSCVLTALAEGWKCVMVENAVSILAPSSTLRNEFGRKRRTMMTGIQTFLAHLPLANPLRYPRIALPLLCRKVCRWMLPPALAASLSVAAVIGTLKFGVVGFLLQAAVMGMAIGLAALRNRTGYMGRISDMAAFTGVVWMAGIAAWGAIVSGQKVQYWEPTPRILPGE